MFDKAQASSFFLTFVPGARKNQVCLCALKNLYSELHLISQFSRRSRAGALNSPFCIGHILL